MSWVRVPLVTLKQEAVSNETKRYSLYFGMLGMSMVPAEIYHDYLRISRKYMGEGIPLKSRYSLTLIT